MKIVSAKPGCAAALAIGLALVADKRGPDSPRGPTGHVEWEAPDGLLRLVPGSEWFDAEAGSGRRWLVLKGPHEGRTVKSFDGSAWFVPSLSFVVEVA